MTSRPNDTWRLKFVPDPDRYKPQVADTWRTIKRLKHDAALLPGRRVEAFEAAVKLETAFLQYLERVASLVRLDTYTNLPQEIEHTEDGRPIVYRVVMAGPFQGFMLLRQAESTVYGAKFVWHKTEV